jgi:hypothetical protein
MLNFPLCLGSCKINFIILWGVWKLQDKLHLTMAYLAQLGSATGVYKTLMKYLVRVPEVWLSWMFNTWLCWLLFFRFLFLSSVCCCLESNLSYCLLESTYAI